MSRWIDRILQEFPQDLSRFWIAADPDDLLLDERVLSSLRERGFELLPFEDSIAFRTEYEERYRAAWARGEPAPSRALILHLRGTEVDGLPWDYLRTGRRISLSLADLFPKLSYNVVRQIGSEYYEGLFEAQGQHNPQSMGDGATKDFILTHIFRISPYLISRPEDLWRELLRLHYRSDGLPPVLASHVATVLGSKAAFGTLPIGNLLSSKSFLLRVVQNAWDHFLALKGVTGSRTADAKPPEEIPDVAIPFEHPDVRVLVDSMFFDGMLQPIETQERPKGVPDWMRVGIVEDPNALEKLVMEGVHRLAGELPSPDASFRDWLLLSRRLGEIIFRFHGIKPNRAEAIATHVTAIQKAADEHLQAWVTRHYADLPSLPAAKSPVMVHHVPRYISLRHDPRQARVVIDTIDEIVHGAVLGKRGIANQIASWCETGFVERLFYMLLDQGFHVYVTADHGNVDVVGVGRPNQGAVSETRGERVRTYRSEILAEFIPAELDAFRLDIAGLPADFLPLYAGTRGAFIRQGDAIVAHGGISVEELIVPFVKVSRVGTGT